jgi:hypothetical protein
VHAFYDTHHFEAFFLQPNFFGWEFRYFWRSEDGFVFVREVFGGGKVEIEFRGG